MKILIWIKINSRSHELSIYHSAFRIFFNNVPPFFADLSVRYKNNKPWILTWGPRKRKMRVEYNGWDWVTWLIKVTQSQLLYSTLKNCIHHENHVPPPEQTLKEARHGEPEQAKSPTVRGKKDSWFCIVPNIYSSTFRRVIFSRGDEQSFDKW